MVIIIKPQNCKIVVGSNICITCLKVIYTPNKDDIILFDDMPIIECPVCKSKDKVMVVTEITDILDILN